MKKLINIQVCTNNRDDNLFKFFLPSLKYITTLKDIITISINYNGLISSAKIKEANEQINSFGFELHYKYNSYSFEPGKHEILKIRYDCNKIDNLNTKYILLADDDLEFKEGYDKQLLIALNYLEKHDEAGIVCLKDCTDKKQYENKNTVYPVDMRFAFCCYGGLLTRRIKEWNGLYPEYCLGLYGGGEEQLQGIEILNYGLTGHVINTDTYAHEQHWVTKQCNSGQGTYYWSWDRCNPKTVSGRISSFESALYVHDKAWKKELYWYNRKLITDYSEYSIQELLNFLG